MLGLFHTTCVTIDFLVDNCLGPLFTTVGTIGHWSVFVFRQFVFRTGYLSRQVGPLIKSAHFFKSARTVSSQVCALFQVYIYICIYIYNKICHNQYQFYTLLSPYPSRSLWVCMFLVKSAWGWSRWTEGSVQVNRFDLLTLWSMGSKLTVNIFFGCVSTSTVDIDRWPIFLVRIDLDGRYRPIFGYYQSNRPSILTVILLKCNRNRLSISTAFSRRCNRTDRRYRPWLTDRSMKTNRPNWRHLWNF